MIGPIPGAADQDHLLLVRPHGDRQPVFLGVGPQSPTPAWGLMVAEAGAGSLTSAPHMLFFPGLAIFLTVLAFVLVGDGLRDALDPKLK